MSNQSRPKFSCVLTRPLFRQAAEKRQLLVQAPEGGPLAGEVGLKQFYHDAVDGFAEARPKAQITTVVEQTLNKVRAHQLL